MSTKGALFAHSSEEYVRYTTQTSTVVRALAIAGIGVIWLYRPTTSTDILSGFANQVAADPTLLIGLILFLSALTFDLLQYAAASLNWARYQHLIQTILATDDLRNNIPDTRSSQLWSQRNARQLAYFITGCANEINPLVYRNIYSARDDDQIVWLARRLLDNAEAYDVNEEAFTKSIASPWSPGRTTKITNGLFWLKIALSIAGYVLLVIATFT